MCTLCQEFRPFEKKCEYDDLPVAPVSSVLANIFEGADAPSNTSTTYTISVGDTFFGNLTASNTDWIRLDIVEGTTYQINLTASGSGDALMRFYDENGQYLGYNDDAGTGTNSLAQFTAGYTGALYISAGEYANNSMNYELSVSAGTAYTEFNLDQIAYQLTNTYWGGSQRKHNVLPGGTLTVNITALTAEGQQLARWALDAWTAVTGINFQEVSTFAAINFDDEDSGAYASSPTSGGIITYSNINVSKAWLANYGTTIDSYSFQTYMHEIGHAMGLGHGGNYNGSAEYGNDNSYRNDSWQQTIMSYFSQSENYNVDATRAFTSTLMAADIIAAQNLYGTSVVNEAGNTTYGANSTVGGYLGDLFKQMFGEVAANSSIYAGNDTAATIFDTGGTDTLDFSPITSDQLINLNEEAQSNVAGRVGNLIIARGSVIENAIGGSGNDTLIGNSAANVLTGNNGNDSLEGGDENDTLIGGDGADTMNGGNGIDTVDYSGATSTTSNGIFLNGSAGWGVAAGDVFNSVENAIGTNGYDIFIGTTGANFIQGLAGGDTFYVGKGDDTVEGGSGNDNILGAEGNDSLLGGLDNDTINGGTGIDYMDGGDGNDTVSYAGLFYSGASGIFLNGSAGWGLAAGETLANFENAIGSSGIDIFIGTTGDNLIDGQDGNDTFYVGSGNDTALGGDGNDAIFGAAGNDSLDGGADNDTIDGGTGADTIKGGTGTDTVTYASATEGGTIRLDGLAGSGNAAGDIITEVEHLIGSDHNDIIVGSIGDTTLEGGNGDDTFWSNKGDDTMTGGAGADTFAFTPWYGNDVITDFTDNVDNLRFYSTGMTVQQLLDAATEVNGDVIFDLGGGNTLTVENITKAALSDDMFAV